MTIKPSELQWYICALLLLEFCLKICSFKGEKMNEWNGKKLRQSTVARVLNEVISNNPSLYKNVRSQLQKSETIIWKWRSGNVWRKSKPENKQNITGTCNSEYKCRPTYLRKYYVYVIIIMKTKAIQDFVEVLSYTKHL